MKSIKKRTILDHMSQNEVAQMFYRIAKDKKMVMRTANNFSRHPHFCMIFSEDSVESELNYTIAAVVNVLVRHSQPYKIPYNKKKEPALFNSYQEGFKSKVDENPYDEDENSLVHKAWAQGKQDQDRFKPDLRLETEDDVTGYFVNAFNKNILKLYSRHSRKKRKVGQMVYLDGIDEKKDNSKSKNKLEAMVSVEPEVKRNYRSTLVEIVLKLREHDSKVNRMNSNNKSQLAKLFYSIVSEKTTMDNEELRKKFNYSPYLLRKNKKELIDLIQKQFGDRKEDILNFLDQRAEEAS